MKQIANKLVLKKPLRHGVDEINLYEINFYGAEGDRIVELKLEIFPAKSIFEFSTSYDAYICFYDKKTKPIYQLTPQQADIKPFYERATGFILLTKEWVNKHSDYFE